MQTTGLRSFAIKGTHRLDGLNFTKIYVNSVSGGRVDLRINSATVQDIKKADKLTLKEGEKGYEIDVTTHADNCSVEIYYGDGDIERAGAVGVVSMPAIDISSMPAVDISSMPVTLWATARKNVSSVAEVVAFYDAITACGYQVYRSVVTIDTGNAYAGYIGAGVSGGVNLSAGETKTIAGKFALVSGSYTATIEVNIYRQVVA